MMRKRQQEQWDEYDPSQPIGAVGSESIPASMSPEPTTSSISSVTNEVDQTSSSDRKSTRLNSSHANISYAVFCLKKKTNPILTSSTSTTTRLVFSLGSDQRITAGVAGLRPRISHHRTTMAGPLLSASAAPVATAH